MTIILQTKYDRPTRQSATNIIEYVIRLLETEPSYLEVVDLCGADPVRGASLEDAVQYIIDMLNDEAPEGYWYYLTADFNLALDCEDD
jgi:hypothetical protein